MKPTAVSRLARAILLLGSLLAATDGYAQNPIGPHVLAGVAVEPRKASWAPPEIDETIPPVDPVAKCALPDVLQTAGEHLKELMSNLEKFTATERIEYVQVTRKGNTIQRKLRSYDYLVFLREIRPGMLTTEEYRNGREGPQFVFADLATSGLPALVLIFHPYFIGDFEMTCEGLGEVNGEPAWQIYFRQRPDRPSRMYGLYVGKRHFVFDLKGRGWISARSNQLLRLEADIVGPVKGAGLKRSHKIITYQPVHFEKQKVDLWLPARAEVYMDLGGRRFQIRHSFANYMLFSVGVKMQIGDPVVPDAKRP